MSMFLCVFFIVESSLWFNARLYVKWDNTLNGSSFEEYIEKSYSIVLSKSLIISRKHINSGNEIMLIEKIYLLSILKYL